MSATFWIPQMGEKFSPSFNVSNGNCCYILDAIDYGKVESYGTFEVEDLPVVLEMVNATLEGPTSPYLYGRLIALREILKVASYIKAPVCWG